MKRAILFAILAVSSLNIQAQFSGKGSGTATDPFQITDADELFEVRNSLSAYYRLMNDVDLTAWIKENNPRQGWSPIGTSGAPFKGNFDGNNHAIINLTLLRPEDDNIGFFGYIETASIHHVAFINPMLNGNDNVGIIGYANMSDITNITVHGESVTGHSNIGGICGYCINDNNKKRELSSCYCSADINSSLRYAAGIVGYVRLNICVQFNRYDGRVVGNQYSAGIVGYASSKNGYSNDTMRENFVSGSIYGEGYGTSTTVGGSNLYGISRSYSLQDTLFCRDQEVSHYIYSLNADDLNIFENCRKVENRDAVTRYGTFYPREQFYKKRFYFISFTLNDGTRYDFDKIFSIIEDSVAPYNILQTRPVSNVSFWEGSKSTISGHGLNGNTIYVLVGDKVLTTKVTDGVWTINLGMIKSGTEARIFSHADGMLPSIITKVTACSEPEKVIHGDANGDGKIDTADVVATINYILGKQSLGFSITNADITGDGIILVDDVAIIVQLILDNQ